MKAFWRGFLSAFNLFPQPTPPRRLARMTEEDFARITHEANARIRVSPFTPAQAKLISMGLKHGPKAASMTWQVWETP